MRSLRINWTLENEEETPETALNNEEPRSLTLSIQNLTRISILRNFPQSIRLKMNTALCCRLLRTAARLRRSTNRSQRAGRSAAYPALRDGIIVRTFDGYEEVTEDTLKSSDFDRSRC